MAGRDRQLFYAAAAGSVRVDGLKDLLASRLVVIVGVSFQGHDPREKPIGISILPNHFRPSDPRKIFTRARQDTPSTLFPT